MGDRTKHEGWVCGLREGVRREFVESLWKVHGSKAWTLSDELPKVVSLFVELICLLFLVLSCEAAISCNTGRRPRSGSITWGLLGTLEDNRPRLRQGNREQEDQSQRTG